MLSEPNSNKESRGKFDMDTLINQNNSRRRLARYVGTGAVALVAATTLGSAAGAATTP